ncbi:MAG TPA: alpha-amylase family glycosyl hydrolase, partial [Flavisolibacter sp.]|nr:alpha-amylase family glycosyl hydrolase [Flavisolibacter sp.]
MHNLISTYRIQFHQGFNFQDLEHIIPYLQRLGIKCIYASPVFAATPGSTHGYDGIDPTVINPEIGTEEQLLEISQRLRAENLYWLQDIVPNHMAFDHRNPWLMDVLEKGQASSYAGFFDISWNGSERLMVPFLGASLADEMQAGNLKLSLKEGALFFTYFDAA